MVDVFFQAYPMVPLSCDLIWPGGTLNVLLYAFVPDFHLLNSCPSLQIAIRESNTLSVWMNLYKKREKNS